MFELFNKFIFPNHLEVGVDVNVNVLRKYIINRFHEIIPSSRILSTLSLLDDVILKLHDENLERIQDDMYSVRENVMYMLSFEKKLLVKIQLMKTNKNKLLSKNSYTNAPSSLFWKTITKSFIIIKQNVPIFLKEYY